MGYLRGGSILRVNLTEGETTTEPVESYAEKFIGGKGINMKLFFDLINPATAPFDAGNLLLFGVGLLVGTPFPAACRVDVISKSPVTGALGNSSIGGYLGAELKFAGYDHLVIEGKAEKPVYLSIRDDEVEIRDASLLWGHDTYETPEMIRKDLNDPGAAVVSIGPAGERLVVYASIMSTTGNAAARTGLGAVMGSKKLKAIAVHGTKGIAVARPQEFLTACQGVHQSIRQNPMYEDLHTYGFVRWHDKEMRKLFEIMGTTWEGAEVISEEEFQKKHLYRRVGCFACPWACFDSYDITDAGERWTGCMKCSPPGDLTWDLRNPDMMVFWKALVRCQRYGLDARSLSNMLAWLMELYERKIINAADTDGIAMEWGSPEAIISMATKVSYREGIGDLLAEGLPSAAKKIGKGAEEYLVMAKGSPSDLHIPSIKSRVIGAAVSPVGETAQNQPQLDQTAAYEYIRAENEASFQEAIKQYKDSAKQEVGMREAADPRITNGKAALVYENEIRTGMCDISGACGYIGLPLLGLVSFETIANLITLGLGTTVTVDDMTQAVLRMKHVERAFGAMLGLSRGDDRVSKGYYTHRRRDDGKRRELGYSEVDLERMKDDYYQLMDWDVRTGLPTRSTLDKFGLSDVADPLGI